MTIPRTDAVSQRAVARDAMQITLRRPSVIANHVSATAAPSSSRMQLLQSGFRMIQPS